VCKQATLKRKSKISTILIRTIQVYACYSQSERRFRACCKYAERFSVIIKDNCISPREASYIHFASFKQTPNFLRTNSDVWNNIKEMTKC